MICAAPSTKSEIVMNWFIGCRPFRCAYCV